MTYTLYSSLGSGGFAVEAALVKAGAPYTFIAVDTAGDAHLKPDFVKLNPMRQVPAMRLPDGSTGTVVEVYDDEDGKEGDVQATLVTEE